MRSSSTEEQQPFCGSLLDVINKIKTHSINATFLRSAHSATNGAELSHLFTRQLSQLKKAGENILIQNCEKDPLMTSLLYPTLQALDIEYLDTDVFYGDSNQKGICMLANEVLEKMGYSKKGYLLSDMYSNLKNMDKISMIESYEKISEKINRMNLQDILYLIEYAITANI